MAPLKASGHQNRPAAWKWTAGRQRASVCAVCLFYLLRLSRAQGMPVGVLNAGSSFSPNSTAFLRNTWERNRTKTSNSLQDGSSSWCMPLHFLEFSAENIIQHLRISISAQNPRLTPVAQCFPHPSTLYPFIPSFSSFLSASFYPSNVFASIFPCLLYCCLELYWCFPCVMWGNFSPFSCLKRRWLNIDILKTVSHYKKTDLWLSSLRLIHHFAII